MPFEPATAPQKTGKLRALTSIRFFAAILVVLYHSIFLVDPIFSHSIDLTHSSLLTRVISLGYVSVSFFFLLSGYILAWVYLRHSTKLPLRRFYLARFARVYPLFLITLLLDTPYLFFLRLNKYGVHEAVAKTTISLGASALMLQAWIPRLGGINFPSWSLSVEAFLYLLFPFLGVALWRLRGTRLLVSALLIYVSGQAAVLLTATRFSIETTHREPVLHVATFALGILLARWQSLKRQRSGYSPELRLHVRIIASLIIILGFFIAIGLLSRIPSTALNDGLLSPIFACVILLLSGSEGGIIRMLEATWIVILGESSYALYLLHIPILHLFMYLGLDRTPGLYPLYLLTCVGLSIASYYLLEHPLRRWISDRALPGSDKRPPLLKQEQILEPVR